MVHVDALRTEARGYPVAGAFPDRTTLLIDAERRAAYEAEGAHHESPYVPSVTCLPPIDAQHAIANFFVEGDRPREHAGMASRALETFAGALVEIEDNLSAALRLPPLMVCRAGQAHPFNLPPIPMYLHAVFGSQDFFGGLRPRIGCRHIRPIAI